MGAGFRPSWDTELNGEQLAAVRAPEGPVLVLAGPGSGKTRVLTYRVAHLVEERGVSAYRIMAVTFTNKAAREMRERLHKLLGPALEELTLGTFHAICARILRRELPQLGRSGSFVIYDREDQLALIRQVLEELTLDPKAHSPASFLARISQAKSELVGPQEYLRRAASYAEEVAGRVYGRYQELLSGSTALDFDDLLMATEQLFRESPDALERYQERYLYILVDEFQDTNLAQYAILRQLAGRHRQLFAVGDPDQSIYSWRNADIRNILHFERDYPEARAYLLERNYRSTQNILDGAQSVISASPQHRPRRLWTDKGGGAPIAVVEVYNAQEEAEFVALEVERLVAEGTARAGECAVMYRTNAQSRAFEDAFVRRGMPYRLVGAVRFYQRREIKDAIAYLRVLVNPGDELSLARIINIPPRGLGQRTLEEARALARREGISLYMALGKAAREGETSLPPRGRAVVAGFVDMVEELRKARAETSLVELLDRTLERTGLGDYVRDGTEEGEERWDNLKELRSVAAEYQGLGPGEGLVHFLEEVALVSDVDNLEDSVDAPTLLTLHSAKGLEFDMVFMVGMEEGLLPHSRSLDEPADLEEERRLCYVGMTRARERLYLVHAYRRAAFGDQMRTEPSRYLADIPPELVAGGGRAYGQAAPAPAAAEENGPGGKVELQFRSGERVRHPQFGEGIVVESRLSGGDEEVTVAFVGMKPKRLLASLAQMEKLSPEVEFGG